MQVTTRWQTGFLLFWHRRRTLIGVTCNRAFLFFPQTHRFMTAPGRYSCLTQQSRQIAETCFTPLLHGFNYTFSQRRLRRSTHIHLVVRFNASLPSSSPVTRIKRFPTALLFFLAYRWVSTCFWFTHPSVAQNSFSTLQILSRRQRGRHVGSVAGIRSMAP